jgi:hypothetical protein
VLSGSSEGTVEPAVAALNGYIVSRI